MGKRSLARKAAFQLIYEMDLNGASAAQVLSRSWKSLKKENTPDTYTEKIVRGVEEKKETIDQKITETSHHWRLERMPVVDRSLLRLAVYELLFIEDVPKRVTLDEAIELAKEFGDSGSSTFINGILDPVAKTINKE